MRTFKLIKNYFDSGLKVGFEITFPDDKTVAEYYNGVYILQFNIEEVEKYPENWQEIIDKNYEILSFRNNEPEGFRMYTKLQRDGSYTCDGSVNGATEKWCFDEGYKIHSVKRLSDGEIFTVGDGINFPSSLEPKKTRFISSFSIDDERMRVMGMSFGCSLTSIKHIKKPLFTTEDGVDIFEGNKGEIRYWTLYNEDAQCKSNIWKISNAPVIVKNIIPYSTEELKKLGLLRFSTKEAAEEYILINKPCLSVNDICTMIAQVRGDDSFNDSNFNKDLVKLVKKKLGYDN